MADDQTRDEVQPKDAGRRALLKAATVAGGAVAASALLPGSWKKPVATIGGLPAHAQTSDTIFLSSPQAFSGVPGPEPDAAGDMDAQIWAGCRYQDTLGRLSDDYFVTFTVGQGNLENAAADGGCGAPATYTLRQIPHFSDGNSYEGWIKFGVNSSCSPPGWISWYFHGEGRTSNVVNASIRINPV